MMVLSRRIGERIVIGEGANQVVLVVVDIYRDKVRLGFESDHRISIDRSEVREGKERAKAK